MAIPEQKPDAQAITYLTIPEVVPLPADYRVAVAGGEEANRDDVHILEAHWSGEAKVSARVENVFGREYAIDNLQRPPHWGPDTRPPEEQRKEFEIGFDGILKEVIATGAKAIEITEQKGLSAEAIAKLQVPNGWVRTWRADDFWMPEGAVDLYHAIIMGAKVSMRYELMVNPPANLGQLATVLSLHSV